jgi:hypothetical protein
MNTLLDRLNLRPQERRFLVVVITLSFVVVNFWLIWPRFKDWGAVQAEIAKTRTKLQAYRRDSNPKLIADYQTRLKELEGEGPGVAADDQSFDLIRAIQQTANQCGIVNFNPGQEVTISSTKTNEYFEEKARRIEVVTGEKELVDFLISIGSSNSLIRARSVVLRPDQSGTRLRGDITLVASYQKKKPKPVEPAAKKSEPAARKLEPAAKKPEPAAKKAEPAAKKPEPAAKKAEPAVKAKTSAPAAASPAPGPRNPDKSKKP